MENNNILASSCVAICSRNPVALWAISNLLARSSLTWCASQFFATPSPTASEKIHIVLFDVSSIPEWPELISKWGAAGYKQILLVAQNWGFGSAQLRALHLGITGIVDVSAGFGQRLTDAITRVANGQLFVHDVAVDKLRREPQLSNACSPASRLSFREEQVLDLLMLGFSNRRIGSVLSISERTVKFHVGNILRKKDVKCRSELRDLNDDTRQIYGQQSTAKIIIPTTLPR